MFSLSLSFLSQSKSKKQKSIQIKQETSKIENGKAKKVIQKFHKADILLFVLARSGHGAYPGILLIDQ